MLLPFLLTFAIEKTNEILLVKGADGWGSLTGGRSITTRPIVNSSVVNGRVNDTFTFIFVLGGN